MEEQYLSKKQREFQRWEFGVFFHFGIRTFYEEHSDWDRVRMPAEAFNPKNMDCGQWVKTAKDAGAKYCVLTAKHHDGFTLWPSKTTRYGVQGSLFKLGRGDVVQEYVDACRKYSMKVGLYYSLAQWGGGNTTENPTSFIGPRPASEVPNPAKFIGRECSETDYTDENYNDYLIAQLKELLTNYGKIDYLWFDGCCPTHVEYDIPKIKETIFNLQPGILLFADKEWNPDVFWIGNEDAVVPDDNTLCPAECDFSIRKTWFWTNDDREIKSSEILSRVYNGTIGKGCNLLLNVPPGPDGLLGGKDKTALLETGTRNGHFVFQRVWIKNLFIIGVAALLLIAVVARSIYVDRYNSKFVYKLSGMKGSGTYASRDIDGLKYFAMGPNVLNIFYDPSLLEVTDGTVLFTSGQPVGKVILQIKPRMNRTCESVVAIFDELSLNKEGTTVFKSEEITMVQTAPGLMEYRPADDTGAEALELFDKYGYMFYEFMQAAIEMWDLEAEE